MGQRSGVSPERRHVQKRCASRRAGRVDLGLDGRAGRSDTVAEDT